MITDPTVPTACVTAHDCTVGTAQPYGNPPVPDMGEPPDNPQFTKKQIDIVVGDNYGRGTYEIKNLHSAFDKLEADIDLFKRGQRVEYNELLHQETTLEKEIFDFSLLL